MMQLSYRKSSVTVLFTLPAVSMQLRMCLNMQNQAQNHTKRAFDSITFFPRRHKTRFLFIITVYHGLGSETRHRSNQ